MNKVLILILMLFLHTIADYNLQGWLAQAKRKDYWENQDKKYQKDYLMALFMHSFQWSFVVLLPLLNCKPYLFLLIINISYHFVIDDLKANKNSINLIQDQLLHIIQIFISWIIYIIAW